MIRSRPAVEVAQVARSGATIVVDGAGYSAPHLKYIAEVAAGAGGSVTFLNLGGHSAPEIGSIASAGPTMELDAGQMTAGQLHSIAKSSAEGRGALVIANSDKLTASQMIAIHEAYPGKIAFR